MQRRRTILYKDIQALLHQQCRIEDYKSVTEGQDIITGPDLEKGAYRPLLAHGISGVVERAVGPPRTIG